MAIDKNPAAALSSDGSFPAYSNGIGKVDYGKVYKEKIENAPIIFYNFIMMLVIGENMTILIDVRFRI